LHEHLHRPSAWRWNYPSSIRRIRMNQPRRVNVWSPIRFHGPLLRTGHNSCKIRIALYEGQCHPIQFFPPSSTRMNLPTNSAGRTATVVQYSPILCLLPPSAVSAGICLVRPASGGRMTIPHWTRLLLSQRYPIGHLPSFLGGGIRAAPGRHSAGNQFGKAGPLEHPTVTLSWLPSSH